MCEIPTRDVHTWICGLEEGGPPEKHPNCPHVCCLQGLRLLKQARAPRSQSIRVQTHPCSPRDVVWLSVWIAACAASAGGGWCMVVSARAVGRSICLGCVVVGWNVWVGPRHVLLVGPGGSVGLMSHVGWEVTLILVCHSLWNARTKTCRW